MSEIYKAYIFCFATTESKNYLNKNGKNPSVGAAIDGSDIVFNKNDLAENKWLFCNENSNIVSDAKKQTRELVRNNDWIGILE